MLYGDLAKKLSKWVSSQAGVTNHDRFFVEEYINLTEALATVADVHFDKNKIEDGYWFRDCASVEILEQVRLDDTFRKFQAQYLLNEIRCRLQKDFKNARERTEDKNIPDGRSYRLWFDLFNKQPCVTIAPRVGPNEDVRMEIQIQGKQYRHMLVLPRFEGFLGSKSEKIDYEKLSINVQKRDEWEWLFGPREKNSPFLIKTARGKKPRQTRMLRPFCKYKEINWALILRHFGNWVCPTFMSRVVG